MSHFPPFAPLISARRRFPVSLQSKIIFVTIYDAFLPQPADLRRKTAAANFQIIFQFLTVIGNGEPAASGCFRLDLQICQQFIPRRPFGCDLDFLVKSQVFRRHHLQKIEAQLIVKRTGIGAGVIRRRQSKRMYSHSSAATTLTGRASSPAHAKDSPKRSRNVFVNTRMEDSKNDPS